MKLFHCQNCQQVVYFENTACVKCGMTLGYLPDQGEMSSVAPDGPNWTAMANPGTAKGGSAMASTGSQPDQAVPKSASAPLPGR